MLIRSAIPRDWVCLVRMANGDKLVAHSVALPLCNHTSTSSPRNALYPREKDRSMSIRQETGVVIVLAHGMMATNGDLDQEIRRKNVNLVCATRLSLKFLYDNPGPSCNMQQQQPVWWLMQTLSTGFA